MNFKKVISLLLFLFEIQTHILSNVKLSKSSNIHVLNPILTDFQYPNKALIIFGGGFCDPKLYIELAQKIQAMVPNLYVILPKCLFNTCFEFLIRSQMNKVYRLIDSFDAQIDEIYLSGHSLAGASLGGYYFNSIKAQKKLHGMILMGAYITRGNYQNKIDSNLPILTISGDLDGGDAKPARMAEDLTWALKRPKAISSKINPLIILQGVSHLQFTSGNVPDKIKGTDLKPELSYEEAHDKISYFISKFILSHTKNPNDNPELNDIIVSSQNIITNEMFGNTFDYLSPILDSFIYEGNSLMGYSTSALVESIQKQISGIENEEFDKIFDVKSESMSVYKMIERFVKPNFTEGSSKVTVTAYAAHRMSIKDLIMDYSGYKTPYEMLIKLKSEKSFKKYLNTNSNNDPSNLCKSIQEHIISWTYDRLPEIVKSRLNKYQQKLTIKNSTIQNIGILWLLQMMKIEDLGENGFEITPKYLYTELDQKPNSIAGMFYCKVWGPSKLMEWFYTDSLKLKRGLLK